MKTRPHGRAAFSFVFITATLDMLALGIISPVLPGLIVEFEGGDVSNAAKVVGWFGFVWAAMQFFAAPALGVLSDRFGRRPVILLSMVGMGLDYILMGMAPSLGWLLVGRIISGLTSATHPVAAAYIADVTPVEQRSARFGILGASFGLGFVIGPAIGGLLGSIDLRLPFWGAAALCLANAAFGYFVLPESLSADRRAPFTWKRANPFGALKLLRSHPELTGLSAATILLTLAHASLPNVIVLYMSFRYGWGERAIGLAITMIGASSAVVGLTLVGPVVKRIGDRATLLLGLIFGTAGFAIYGFASHAEIFVLGIGVMSLWGLANAPMQTFMSRRVSAHEQGQLQGALTSLRGLAGMAGPPFFGWIFSLSIDPHARVQIPGAPYFIAALALAAAYLVTARITRP